MELHQLRYFCAIVETGSFSRAAQQSHVSQPSLSQQISKLENELGARLFDRLGRTVQQSLAAHFSRGRELFFVMWKQHVATSWSGKRPSADHSASV